MSGVCGKSPTEYFTQDLPGCVNRSHRVAFSLDSHTPEGRLSYSISGLPLFKGTISNQNKCCGRQCFVQTRNRIRDFWSKTKYTCHEVIASFPVCLISYRCECDTLRTGLHCENDIAYCESTDRQICQNGGDCWSCNLGPFKVRTAVIKM